MEVWLGCSFLPLLLLAWLRVGLAHQISAMIDVSVGLDLVLQCLVQTGSNSTAGEANWCKTIQNNTEDSNKGGMEMQKCSALFVFTIVNTTCTACAPEALQTKDTKKETWTGLKFLLCIIFGFAVGMLLYVPIIGLLLWRCRRKGKGKLTSRQVAEGNQLSTAAPVTGTEDLTYASLKFEKKGTKPSSSNVVYTEIKPLQQKQSDGDAGAANAGMDVSSEGESK